MQAQAFRVGAAIGTDSDESRLDQVIGLVAKHDGEFRRVSSTKIPDMSIFYSFVMLPSLTEIRARDIWLAVLVASVEVAVPAAEVIAAVGSRNKHHFERAFACAYVYTVCISP